MMIEGNVEINQDLKTFDEAKFEVFYENWILEYNKVILMDEYNNEIFNGWIYEIEPYFDKIGLMQVTIRGQKAIMKDRAVLTDYAPVNVDVKTVINTLLNQYNNWFGDTWTLDSDIVKNVSIDVKVWDNFFDIFDELADQCEAFRDVQGWVVAFKTIIGEDKTLWPNYQEIIFNGAMTSANNIANIKLVRTAKRANLVVWVSKSGSKQFLSDYQWYVYGFNKESFRDWDLNDKTQKLLAKNNVYHTVYNVSVENNTVNANKGDKIMLRIENTMPIFDIDSPVWVIWKKTTYQNAELREEITVSDLSIEEKTLENVLNKFGRKINLIT